MVVRQGRWRPATGAAMVQRYTRAEDAKRRPPLPGGRRVVAVQTLLDGLVPDDGALTLVTIGYGGRGVGDFVGVLQRAGVQLLVDVRISPRARVPGFSKTALARFLVSHGVAYRHVVELGNASRHDPEDAPLRLVDEPRGLSILQTELEAGRVVAIMCACRAWADCHRAHISAQMVSRLTDLQVLHL